MLGEVSRFESRFERAARSSRTAWKASTDPADLTDIVYDLGTHLADQAQLLFGPRSRSTPSPPGRATPRSCSPTRAASARCCA
ncbi:Gfo/Idh/MocA family oxidoreductase [Actinokineospora soli]|uniref:Gfo/Idh/MocA family oxidoreductase n=1 Tax=Actinokineospora soli TaxID=1048753 RepID=A0ABW2TS96_9PSEU